MSATAIEEKKTLRRWVKGLPRPDWDPLLNQFLALTQVEVGKTILIFYGMEDEPNTKRVAAELLRRGKRVALPRCLPEGGMEARLVFDLSALSWGRYGIPEPGGDCPLVKKEELDVILVPNLCCDRAGYRLGRGGGYYDRYLVGFQGLSVALCPKDRLVGALPHEEFDLPVDLVLTDEEGI